MKKSIRADPKDRLEGVTDYWTFEHLSNASMKGFNDKTRWLNHIGLRIPQYGTPQAQTLSLPKINCEKLF